MIQFTQPIYLLLFPPLVYLAWRFSKVSLADLSKGRKYFSFGLRVLIIVLLVLAISGIQMVKSSKQMAVIFVLDISDSIPIEKRQEALSYIREAVKHKKQEDYIGIIAFGSDASVELAPSQVGKIDRIRSEPSTSYTDISQALGLAIASFPAEASKRIVLISDGNENLGEALDQAAMADTEGITIDVIPVNNNLQKETLFDKMVAPGEVKIGEPFELKLIASARTDAHAEVRLLRNGEPVDRKTVSLSPGKNVFSFQQTIDKAGVYTFTAFMESDADTQTENNQAIGVTEVRGKPKVLYVEGKPGQAVHAAKALSVGDIDVEVRNQSGIPISLDELRNYDAVILSDVMASAMHPEQMKIIESGVKDLGIGFGMVGGDSSFGAGGYFNTPIERTLPVDMSIRKQKVVPTLSVVIVIDKSGSMGIEENGRTKISLANEAAVNVVMLMQPIDKVGVIFCHDYPTVTVPLTLAKNKDSVAAQISTVNAAGGGITVYPSLKAAYNLIRQSGTRQKHVIMLCDGGDCDEPGGCIKLAAKMQKEGITVTAVAIGDGKDVPFLKDMARAGGGNFYLARKAAELPYIFTRDVLLVSKSLLIEEPFRPKVDPSASVLAGIDWDSMPPLLGYVATSPKGLADVPMISHKDDPIYAQWQYGLGRSIAFTSDAKPRWAVRWLEWDGFTRFWAQAIRWSMKKTGQANFQTTLDIERARGKVTVDVVDQQGQFVNFLKLEGRLIGPDMKSHNLHLEQTAPGRYEAEFPARDVGTYTVNIIERKGKDVIAQSSSITIPYPPEYKDIQTNERLLTRLAEMTNGKLDIKPSEVFRRNIKQARVPTDLWWTFALVGLLLFPLDVAVRRLAMDSSEVLALVNKALKLIKTKKKAAKPDEESAGVESVDQLLSVKKSRQPAGERPEWARPVVTEEKPKTRVRQTAKEQSEPVDQPEQPIDPTSRLLEAKRRAREKHNKD